MPFKLRGITKGISREICWKRAISPGFFSFFLLKEQELCTLFSSAAKGLSNRWWYFKTASFYHKIAEKWPLWYLFTIFGRIKGLFPDYFLYWTEGIRWKEQKRYRFSYKWSEFTRNEEDFYKRKQFSARNRCYFIRKNNFQRYSQRGFRIWRGL